MTREEAKELAEILLAYGDGKEIEYFAGKRWQSADNLIFDGNPENYRIKPEKKLVPFTFEDMDLLKDKWFTNVVNIEGFKPLINKFKPIHYNEGGIGFYIEDKEYFVSFTQLLLEFKFEDGSPCGKYIEE